LVNSCFEFLWNKKKIDIIAADQMALDYEKSIKEAEEQINKI